MREKEDDDGAFSVLVLNGIETEPNAKRIQERAERASENKPKKRPERRVGQISGEGRKRLSMF